ncbi:MAG: tRNA (adenosine(37)-N6)-threonylcarbamoyltransferase complex ATPase subunit type 1 TsaE [Candidatus Paceibacterota bacterium]
MSKSFSQPSFSTKQTKQIAKYLALKVLKGNHHKTALILALTGELGSGKTTFIQGFLRAVGVKKRITSPTFIIIRRYNHIYHIDCYRIKKPKEILDLGLKEIINNPQNIVLIEWADNIKKLLPRNTIWIRFKHGDKEKERIIKIL